MGEAQIHGTRSSIWYTAMPPTNVEAMHRYVPSFTVDTIAGVGHAGILLQRVEDFDARLLAIVERFASTNAANQAGVLTREPL